MSSENTPFAFLWNNALLSDYKLVLTGPEQDQVDAVSPDVRATKRRRLFGLFGSGGSGEAGKPGDGPRTLDVHGAVLTAASEHFKSIIQNLGPDTRTLHIREAPETHDAVLQLVKFCYIWALDDDVSQPTLVKLMLLADKYQVTSCLQACAQRFGSVQPQQLQWEALERLFQLPAALQEAEAFGDVMGKARDKLFAAFTPLDTAWNSGELRTAFLALPFKALELLLRSGALQVVSENTVLVAAAGWLAHDSRRRGRARALYELLRLQHLSHTFLGDVLPQLPAFSAMLTVADCLRVAQYRAADGAVRSKLHRDSPACALLLPPRAQAQARIGMDITLQEEDVRAAQQRSLQSLLAQCTLQAVTGSDEELREEAAPSSAHSGSTLYSSPGRIAAQRASEPLWSSSFCTNGFACKLSAAVHSAMTPRNEPSSRLVLALECCAAVGDSLLAVPSAKLSLAVEAAAVCGAAMSWGEQSLEEAAGRGSARVLEQRICTVAGDDQVVEGARKELAQLVQEGGELRLRVAVSAS